VRVYSGFGVNRSETGVSPFHTENSSFLSNSRPGLRERAYQRMRVSSPQNESLFSRKMDRCVLETASFTTLSSLAFMLFITVKFKVEKVRFGMSILTSKIAPFKYSEGMCSLAKIKEAKGRAGTVRSNQRSSNTLYCRVNVRVNDEKERDSCSSSLINFVLNLSKLFLVNRRMSSS